MTLVAAAANVVSVLYYLRLREEGADDLRSGRNMRSPEFVGEKWRTIHIVGEQSYQWREKEFQGGFEHCPNYRNCKYDSYFGRYIQWWQNLESDWLECGNWTRSSRNILNLVNSHIGKEQRL